jgi:hypothetical protein
MLSDPSLCPPDEALGALRTPDHGQGSIDIGDGDPSGMFNPSEIIAEWYRMAGTPERRTPQHKNMALLCLEGSHWDPDIRVE